MRAKTITIDPDAVDPNGIYTIAAVSALGELTLAGVLVSGTVATMDYARRIGIISAGVDTGITFTIVGTDADGRAISEAVTGASTATATSIAYFKTITSITASGAAAGNVTIGTVDEFVLNAIPLNHYAKKPATVSIESKTGTIDFTIQETFSDIWKTPVYIFQDRATDITIPSYAEVGLHAHGVRLRCNSYTNGAKLKFTISSNG